MPANPGQWVGQLLRLARPSLGNAIWYALPNYSIKGNNNRTDYCPLISGVRPMNRASRLIAAATLFLASSSAIASDGFGIATFLVGVPLLFVTSLVLGVMRAFSPSQTIKVAAAVLFVPALLFSFYLIPDALSIFRYGILKPDATIGFAFFVLLAIACWLFYSLVRR